MCYVPLYHTCDPSSIIHAWRIFWPTNRTFLLELKGNRSGDASNLGWWVLRVRAKAYRDGVGLDDRLERRLRCFDGVVVVVLLLWSDFDRLARFLGLGFRPDPSAKQISCIKHEYSGMFNRRTKKLMQRWWVPAPTQLWELGWVKQWMLIEILYKIVGAKAKTLATQFGYSSVKLWGMMDGWMHGVLQLQQHCFAL